jgi:hypothetical protein
MAAVRQVVDYVSAWWWPSQPIGPPIEIKIHLVYSTLQLITIPMIHAFMI